MKLLHLLRHDWKVLWRNKLIAVSVAVTCVYVLVLKGISSFIGPEKALVMIVFNDPALLGFLFVGAVVLFEKNENTLQALGVTPFSERLYIWSKTTILTAVSVACCFAMVLPVSGTAFNMLHFFFGSCLTTVLFSFLGFILVSGVSTFNHFILKAVGLLIFLSLPFLGYFGVVPRSWFLLVPTQPCIDLFRAAFHSDVRTGEKLYAYVAALLWIMVAYLLATRRFLKDLRS